MALPVGGGSPLTFDINYEKRSSTFQTVFLDIYEGLEREGLVRNETLEAARLWLKLVETLTKPQALGMPDEKQEKEKEERVDISFIMTARNDGYGGGDPGMSLSRTIEQLIHFPWKSGYNLKMAHSG